MTRLRNALSPVSLLIGTMVLTALLLAWLSWNVYISYQATQVALTQDVRLYQLRSTIIYLDEVLTMSARLAATTGDPVWSQRYTGVVNQLDAAIKEAISLAPPELATQLNTETNAANLRLVEIETAALSAVQEGRTADARKLMFSAEYNEHKRSYAEGMGKLLDYLDQQAAPQQQRGQQRLVTVLISLVIFLPLLLIIWIAVLRYLRATVAVRETLIVTQTREKTLEQTQVAQETIISERTTALQQALRTAEEREVQLVRALSEVQSSQAALRDLSAPILPVLRGVLVAPIIGSLDTQRAMALTERVLNDVAQYHAHTVIFDVTGVPVVDTHVAQVLLSTTAAVRLLGAKSLLVGIRPEVAQTIISLGIDLVSVHTYPNLQEAVESLHTS